MSLKVINLFVMIAAASATMGTTALAECQLSRVKFFPEQNDTINATATTNGAACVHSYYAGSSFSYTSSAIVSAPSHGSLTQSGTANFRYVPAKGFHGADAYALKVCGTSRQGTGCSTLKYAVTVQ